MLCSSSSPLRQHDLPSLLTKKLTVVNEAEPVAGQGARAVTTLVILPSSHHRSFHTRVSHVPVQAPLEHQLLLTPVSSPSATGWHAQGHWPAADGQTPEGMEPACLFLLQWLRRKAECQTLPRVQAGAAGGRARRGRREPSLFLFQEKLIWKRETSPPIPASRWGGRQLPRLLTDPTLIH